MEWRIAMESENGMQLVAVVGEGPRMEESQLLQGEGIRMDWMSLEWGGSTG